MHGDAPASFAEEFDGSELDRGVWMPNYLPHWSSRSASAATYEIAGGSLRLWIPREQGLWCADDHRPPLRVSAVQSGTFSGPVGSTIGQQPYRDGLLVREEQEPFRGWTPGPCFIEIRMRATVSSRSMVAFWMVGLEDRPERSAEICVAEIFGKAVLPRESAEIGMGVHRFRDPDVDEDWEAIRLPIDVAAFHDYAVDWRPDRVEHLIDGRVVRTTPRPPTYPMQMMIAVFDFPEMSNGDDDDLVPELIVDHIRATPAGAR